MKEFTAAVNVRVVSPEPAISASFIGLLCGSPATSGRASIEEEVVQLDAAGEEALDSREPSEAGERVHGYILLVHHLDELTLEAAKRLHDKLTSLRDSQLTLALYRFRGEADFKINCPSCGQKLLVADAHVNRIGQCPHCKDSIRLPLPDMHLRMRLNLPKATFVHLVSEANPGTARNALKQIVQRAAKREQMLKSTTMRIQIAPANGGT
jgi:hypothetical protein